jgi:hypothetical protein
VQPEAAARVEDTDDELRVAEAEEGAAVQVRNCRTGARAEDQDRQDE